MRRLVVAVAVILGLGVPLCADTPSDRPPWDKLGLASVEVDGQKLYYDRSFESQRSALVDAYRRALADRQRLDTLKKRSDAILVQISRITGAQVDQLAMGTLYGRTLSLARWIADANVCVVDGQAVKDYLKNGGSLPGCSYDARSGGVTFSSYARSNVTTRPNEPCILLCPVRDPAHAASQLSALLALAARDFSSTFILHESTELAILRRLGTADPHFRWFTDGFANAISERLAAQFLGKDAADQMAALWDISEFAAMDLTRINLAYWLRLDAAIRTPLESESQLESARYALATFEANRLIDAHGLDKVRLILDKAAANTPTRSEHLFAAIREVTGEDMRQRLMRYQRFTTADEGLGIYDQQYRRASDRKEFVPALIALLRYAELLPAPEAEVYVTAAELMRRAGYDEAGAELLRVWIDRWIQNDRASNAQAFRKVLLQYALRADKPALANDEAAEVLKTEPDNVPALTIIMLGHQAAGRQDEAMRLARLILDEPQAEMAAVVAARKVLGLPELKPVHIPPPASQPAEEPSLLLR